MSLKSNPPGEQKAYTVQHHDEGINTKTYKYMCEGFRIVSVTSTQRKFAQFLSQNPTHSSGFSKAVIPKDDLPRFFNNYTIGWNDTVVLHIPAQFFEESLLDIARQSDEINIVEIGDTSEAEIIEV